MKLLKVPAVTGKDWWVLVHDYVLKDEWLRNLRPIHVFTQLSLAFVDKKEEMLKLSMALENKLFSSINLSLELRKAISEIGDPIYSHLRIRDYAPHQKTISFIESYLNAIYSALEASAQINRLIHAQVGKSLPMSFSDQAKKFKLFSFKTNQWLSPFFDIRRELTHFNTPLIDLTNKSLVIKFSFRDGLMYFKPGEKQSVSLDKIMSFYMHLFTMLDLWAKEMLEQVDEHYEYKVGILLDPKDPIKFEEIKAKVLLDLIGL